jgi:hypothetical protein
VSDQAAPEAGYTIASDRQSEGQSRCKPGTVRHGEEFFQHKTPFDRSSLTRWRQRRGEEKLVALIQESFATATGTGAARQSAHARLPHEPKWCVPPRDARSRGPRPRRQPLYRVSRESCTSPHAVARPWAIVRPSNTKGNMMA